MPRERLIVEIGASRAWWQKAHIHFFQLRFATFAHHYEQCRCGTRRARSVGHARPELPLFTDWLEGKE